MKAIDSFRLIRFDTQLADHIMDLGCLTLDVFPECMNLWFRCGKLEEVRTLFNAEAEQLKVKLDWVEARET